MKASIGHPAQFYHCPAQFYRCPQAAIFGLPERTQHLTDTTDGAVEVDPDSDADDPPQVSHTAYRGFTCFRESSSRQMAVNTACLSNHANLRPIYRVGGGDSK